MTKSTITREQAQQIIDAADEVITALAGTNDEVHKDDTDKMVRLWDDLNDRHAPPEVVRELARMALAAMDSEPDRNPVLAYADSYRDMAKQGVWSVPIWSVITDLERNIAPLYRHAQSAPASPVCTCPSGDGSLRWPCPVHPGNSPAIPDSARDALEKALAAMEFMGDTLNNLDAVCTEDVELVAPAFDAVRSVLAAALQEGK